MTNWAQHIQALQRLTGHTSFLFNSGPETGALRVIHYPETPLVFLLTTLPRNRLKRALSGCELNVELAACKGLEFAGSYGR